MVQQAATVYRLGADNFINVYNGRRSEVEGRGGHGHQPLRRMAQRAASLKFKVACLCAMPVLRLSFPVIKILNLIYEIYTRAWITSACPTSSYLRGTVPRVTCIVPRSGPRLAVARAL